MNIIISGQARTRRTKKIVEAVMSGSFRLVDERGRRGRPRAALATERPQETEADANEDELHRRQQAVEVDALVEAALRDQPRVRCAVGEVEVDGHEDRAERGERRRAENRHAARVRQALPAQQPDQRGGDERQAYDQLADLDQVAERARVRDDRTVEEALVPAACPLRFSRNSAASPPGNPPRTTLVRP